MRLRPHPRRRHRLLVDGRACGHAALLRRATADGTPRRLIVLGIEDPAERARLIAAGCAEALPATTLLAELDARVRRTLERFDSLPRWRIVGPLMLDLFHRDGQIGERWLGLHPREFSLLWRLAEHPGAQFTRRQLLHDVWRLDHDPETNSLEVHVSPSGASLHGWAAHS